VRLGSHFTDEQKAKMMGHKETPETRAKISTSLTGHLMSLETRAKISAAHTNPSPETRAKQSAVQIGRKASPETRAKISAALMGHAATGPKHHTSETRGKISVAQLGTANSGWKGGEQVWTRKHSAKRRTLGFHPLNSSFPGSDAHHINQNDVIHIPHELHCSTYHNQHTGQGMAEMNMLAEQFLTKSVV
jgi:hypothetical protein